MVAHYERQLVDVQSKIDNLLNAIMAGIVTQDTKSKMVELEGEKADLLYRIDGEKLNQTITLTEDEVLFWLLQFRQRKEDDKQYGERLIDTFVNKVIAYDDKIVIVFNIKGVDGNELSIDEIISEIEKSDPTSSEFGFEQYGAPKGLKSELIIRRLLFAMRIDYTPPEPYRSTHCLTQKRSNGKFVR